MRNNTTVHRFKNFFLLIYSKRKKRRWSNLQYINLHATAVHKLF